MVFALDRKKDVLSEIENRVDGVKTGIEPLNPLAENDPRIMALASPGDRETKVEVDRVKLAELYRSVPDLAGDVEGDE
jgi:hypothetical protein